jgi:hypothetical protein
MAIKVLKPGLATTVQDAGREGYYNVGVPLSGALDQYSFRAANLLVGNDENTAVLECTLMGPELEFQRDADVVGYARDADDAVGEASANVVRFGYFTCNVLLLDPDRERLDATAREQRL